MLVDEPKTLKSHLTELRNRLLKVVVCFMLCFAGCYGIAQKLQSILLRPLAPILEQGRTLVYTSLPEAFFSEINVALFSSLLLVFPFFLIQLWLFSKPGLFKREQQIFRGIAACIPILFYIGIAFAQFVVLPLAFSFFISFEHKGLPLYFLPKLSDYISFAERLMLVFGLGFELPVLLFTLVSFEIISVKDLKSRWRMVVFVICAISAVITPPDALSMLALAIPMIILYGATILVVQYTQAKIRHSQDSHYA